MRTKILVIIATKRTFYSDGIELLLGSNICPSIILFVIITRSIRQISYRVITKTRGNQFLLLPVKACTHHPMSQC